MDDKNREQIIDAHIAGQVAAGLFFPSRRAAIEYCERQIHDSDNMQWYQINAIRTGELITEEVFTNDIKKSVYKFRKSSRLPRCRTITYSRIGAKKQIKL
jgi:hypothetical protein